MKAGAGQQLNQQTKTKSDFSLFKVYISRLLLLLLLLFCFFFLRFKSLNMCIICIRNLNSSKSWIICFRLQGRKFPKRCPPYSEAKLTNWQVWRRMVCKSVIYEGLSMSITPQSLAEPPFALLYLSYRQIHRLIPQNKKWWPELETKVEQINWRHMTSSAFFTRF